MELRDCGAVWATGSASPQEIDRVNIRQATYLAMRRAIEQLLDRGNPKSEIRNPKQIQNSNFETLDFGIVSNFDIRASDFPMRPYALVDAWHVPDLPIPQRAIIHGDRLVKSVAAASIIAKVTRDALMVELDAQFPQYGLKAHRGYATAAHREAIRKYGYSVIHRLTFRFDSH
jgi:ribonuclease HII